MLYLQLFWEFFKTGLFAVGGGLATLPFLQDMADRTGWFTHAQLADMLAVSESTPGPIGVNMATYVGFTTGGEFHPAPKTNMRLFSTSIVPRRPAEVNTDFQLYSDTVFVYNIP